MNKKKKMSLGKILGKILFFLLRPPVYAAILSMVIMTYVLIMEPIIGMADNGDFSRIIHKEGIYKYDEGEEDSYLSYFESRYKTKNYYNEVRTGIISTHTYFIRAAKWLDRLFTGDDGEFDIRFLGFLMMLYNALGIYMIVDYATYKKPLAFSYLVAILAVFTFADTAYTAYFNSFFQEGLVETSFLAFTSALLLMTQHRYDPIVLIIAAVFHSAILIGSKQQNALLGILIGIMFFILSRTMISGKTNEDGYIKNPVGWKHFMVILAVIYLVSAVVFYKIIPEKFVYINQYHAMTRGVMMTSDNPETALEFFNVSKQYSLLNKSLYYERYPVIDVENPILVRNFYAYTGFTSILAYYVLHPNQLYQMINLATHESYIYQPQMIGNYEKKLGKEAGARTDTFTLHSRMMNRGTPKSAGFVVLWVLLAVMLNFRDINKDVIIFILILMGLSQIIVSTLGAGDADLTKHVFLYNLTYDLMFYLFIIRILGSLAGAFEKKISQRSLALDKSLEYKSK